MLLEGLCVWRIPGRSWLGWAELLPARGFPVLPTIAAGTELLERAPLPCTSTRAGGKQQLHPPGLPPERGDSSLCHQQHRG